MKQMFKFYYQLSNILRFNTRTRIRQESVAEHSFHVALIAMIIADKIPPWAFNLERVLQLALIHDLPEIETGDIPYNVKGLFNIDGLERDFFHTSKYKDLYGELLGQFSVESQIVSIADAVAAQLYIEREHSLGNLTLASELNHLEKVLKGRVWSEPLQGIVDNLLEDKIILDLVERL